MNVMQQYRIKANKTQAEISTKLKWSTPQFISNIERGLAPIPPKHFKGLNRELNIPIKKMMLHNIDWYVARMKREMKR